GDGDTARSALFDARLRSGSRQTGRGARPLAGTAAAPAAGRGDLRAHPAGREGLARAAVAAARGGGRGGPPGALAPVLPGVLWLDHPEQHPCQAERLQSSHALDVAPVLVYGEPSDPLPDQRARHLGCPECARDAVCDPLSPPLSSRGGRGAPRSGVAAGAPLLPGGVGIPRPSSDLDLSVVPAAAPA